MWRRGLGGAALLIVCFMPPVLLGLAADPGSLRVNDGGGGFDYGGFLSALPGLVGVALLAPLVGYRRRDAVMLLIPVWNIYIAWLIGARVADLALTNNAVRVRTRPSDEQVMSGVQSFGRDR
jgi:hypothetical protein